MHAPCYGAELAYYETDGTGTIVHDDTGDLTADLLSKPLTGDAFFKHRATALGIRALRP